MARLHQSVSGQWTTTQNNCAGPYWYFNRVALGLFVILTMGSEGSVSALIGRNGVNMHDNRECL